MNNRMTAEEYRKQFVPGIPRNQTVNTIKNEANPHTPVSHPKPKRDIQPALGSKTGGKKEIMARITVRFTGYRVRPLDPDNFAGGCKGALDGLRHANLIPGDEPWRIIFQTEQVKVGSFKEEKTVIEIDDPNIE
jgi:hypothetical protein